MQVTASPSFSLIACRIVAAVLALLSVTASTAGRAQDAAGDPERGKAAIRAYGCGGCHRIPHVAGANGRVGPPLERMAKRAYIGGVLPNTEENMVRWIRAPDAVDPRTAMPDLGVSERDARDITAYLYTLR